MFVSEKIVFVELHKTGCTHIGKLLSGLIEGRQQGKHNRPTESILNSGRSFLGSVRDPWDWYVSLWAYGCDGKGAVYETVTKSTIKLRERGWRNSPIAATHSLIRDLIRSPSRWKRAYTHVDDPSGFRDWPYMMNDAKYWHDVGDGYGSCQPSAFAGFMTYRYMRLFCRNEFQHIASYADLRAFEANDCYIDYFVRNEYLEDDLVSALESCGVAISEAQRDRIYSQGKTNASSRSEKASYYYDRDSIDLVRARERLIVEKFAYSPPSL